MKIAVDIMGGDYAPEEAFKGVQLFLEDNKDESVHLLLVGTPEAKEQFASLIEPYGARYTYIDAPQVITMSDNPTKAMKEKQQSSIAIGFGLLAAKKADAFLSAGNTGAMMVGAMYSVKSVPGIIRPTIACPVPLEEKGKFNLLLDVGLNADCKAEHLVQFAKLGSMYAKHVMGIEDPRVGLLNLGEEDGKGNLVAQAAFPMLKEYKDINFAGNIEGRDIFSDKAHIIVCEGFVGNVVLKMMGAMYSIVCKKRGVDDSFVASFNHELYGGIPILGINDTVIVGHGISHALAFKNMIESARVNVNAAFPQKLASYYSSIKEEA